MPHLNEMIRQYFQSFKVFTQDELDGLISHFRPRLLKKKEYFIREGEKSNDVAFIKSGIFRSFYNTTEGDDVTYCFRFPNDLLAAYSSFITGDQSQESMQAISDAELLVIQKDSLECLAKDNLNWTLFLKTIAEQQYIELEKRVFQLQRNSAVQRYSELLTNEPEFVQQIPLQYLATYLGITQRHLSRIRREVTF